MKLIGALGLILISIGIVTKERKKQNVLFIVGGLLLEAYSIWLEDPVFIVLQLVFVASAVYDYAKRA